MRPPKLQIYLTSSDGVQLLQRLPDWSWTSEVEMLRDEVRSAKQDVPGPSTAIFVDAEQERQSVFGFGATFADSSAYLISRMEPAERRALLERLFGPRASGGVGLNVLRLPVGATDNSVNFSLGSLTYDDVPDDFALANFSIAKDEAYYLPMLREVLEVNPKVGFIASPWTAPLWLKSPSGEVGEGTLQHNVKAQATYADYLVRYLTAYRAAGIEIDYLTLQNEPGHGGCGPMPCMVMRPEQEANLATLLAQRLLAANLSHVRLLAYDHNWATTFPEQLVRQLVTIISCVWVLCVGLMAWMLFDYCCRRHIDSAAEHRFVQRSRADSGVNEYQPAGESLKIVAVWCLFLGIILWHYSAMFPSAFPQFLSGMPIGIEYPLDVLTSSAGPLFAGVAWHCYGGHATVMAQLDRKLQSSVEFSSSRHWRDLEHHVTECTSIDQTFAEDLAWNQDELLISSMNHGARSILQWSLALDEDFGPRCVGGSCCSRCRGVVTVPRMAPTFHGVRFNTEFWGLAHHSAFVERGSRRVLVQGADHSLGVHATGYVTPSDEVVLVVANINMNSTINLNIRCNGFGFTFPLQPGVATFVWKRWH